jgi:hypothetical protein
VKPGGLPGIARPPLFGTVTARLDSTDPRDVYRVVVPAGRTITATVASKEHLGPSLWSASIRSVRGSKRRRAAPPFGVA